jgi:beta-glucosidase
MEFLVEKGYFKVMVGSSSEDIRLTGKFYIDEDIRILPQNKKFFSDVVLEEN